MKKLIALAVVGLTIVACTTTKQTESVKDQEDLLKERLDTLRQKGYMFGHQDDPFYGLTWEYQNDSSDVKNVCGDWPAVMGFELGGIEMGDEKNLDSVPFTKMREEIIKHHQRGGIITISWHPRNPVTTIDGGGNAGQKFPEGTAWDISDSTVVKNILKGGSQYEKFQTWMQRLSKFLASLTTDDGQKIPITESVTVGDATTKSLADEILSLFKAYENTSTKASAADDHSVEVYDLDYTTVMKYDNWVKNVE